MRKMNLFKISVIIPVHETQDPYVLNACLNAITLASLSPFEIILVIDGKKLPLNTSLNINKEIIQLKTGLKKGPAFARNLGAEVAKGDLLCFIDSDVVIPKNFFQSIQKEFCKTTDLSAIIGSYDNTPHEQNFLSQYRNLLHHFVHQNSREEASTFWGACGIIRKDIFLELKGFNHYDYPEPSIEDIELGYRLKAKGKRIRLCKQLQIKHLKKWTPIKMIKTDLLQRALPWTKLLLQKDKMDYDLNLQIKDRLSVVIVFGLLLTLLLIWLSPIMILLACFLVGLFLIINQDLYKFFVSEKNIGFALRVIPWQILFYLISGAGYSLGFTLYQWEKINKVEKNG